MKLTTPMTITAADSETRIITGRIVAFEEPANASTGKVVFAKGSIKPSPVKLNLEHDRTRPIGKTLDMTLNEDSIDASFKISNTTAGSDAIAEAMDGLRDGFSIELAVDEYVMEKDGTMRVLMGELTGVALVTEPAVRSARVSDVAATEGEEETPEDSDSTVEPDVIPTEGDEVENTVTDASAVETVEAAQSVTANSKPIGGFTSKPRSPITTGGSYLEHTIKAKLGNEDSRQYVLAADDSFTTNPAFSPVSYVRDVAQNTNADRPVIEACGGTRPLSTYGMTVSIPKITANSTAATVAEGGDPTGTTQITSAYVNATVIKKMGFQRYSVELLDRSDPSFYEIMLANLRDAYAQATDAYVIAQITAGGTQATATAADSAGLISFVSTEAPAAYTATKRTAKSFVSGTSVWTTLLGATDTTGRPIYNAGNPMNNAGSAIPTSIRGNVLGLDYYVDPNMVSTSIDESAFIIEPRSIEIFESPALTLATNVPTTGEIEISLYGYIAAQAVFAGGLRRFNLT
ncbi:major_cap_HK97, phage major capsid protein, HK97 family [uncultured Caudovirales phage]|uniref:Major_cap_HK97, phage major capsid protein, HK97 family n=1 Tax=uncultured Caudovirales phage TaxID=2100421 RepID=A0A6J7X7V0_9CAUD|nr:major_cap_HK97, phage major capsid protein, HK97 family [uncultured Caudovirales phage]CAB4181106.1 major_cap_HK97, phage major capsid protein, HK97 family [uncultured Caudovirales phage]CAB4204539.1 major_cap_HK97, phage major capsid protein, HK97 family [uncultured Caudovirales phage]CAB5225743.1 major_cap_HK97, phage major capsid protein, HK97 family [uncultured Caudovirales phage]